MTIALIDMDLVVFRCAASAENESVDIAEARTSYLLDRILNRVDTKEYKAFLSSKTNFRKEVYPEYKANRTAEKPIHLEHLRNFAVQQLNAHVAPDGLEADDMLAIEQTEDTIICTLDKDLLQVAGHHYQWEIGTSTWSRPEAFIFQTELEGLRLFYEQCLKGDTSDNVKGISKIGPVKAWEALEGAQTEQEMFGIVKGLYNNDEEFHMNAKCLWILRSLDDNFTNRFKELNANFQE